jgi:hypothetical protein
VVWETVQGFGALAGIVALAVQGLGAWKRRRVPRDVSGLRTILDTAYEHLVPVSMRVQSGTGSLELVQDANAVNVCIDMVRYANRLADPKLAAAVRTAGHSYMLAYALGANLDVPHDRRDPALIKQQLTAARTSLDAVRAAYDRPDEMERKGIA